MYIISAKAISFIALFNNFSIFITKSCKILSILSILQYSYWFCTEIGTRLSVYIDYMDKLRKIFQSLEFLAIKSVW
jgi:hypothetical protein